MIEHVDIDLIPLYDRFTDTVVVDVVVSCPNPIRIVASDIAFEWNPRELTLVDCHDERATVPNLMAGFPPPSWDFYGANETIPPADGNGWGMWLSPLNGIPVVMEKAVLFSFVFEVHSDKSVVSIAESIDESYPLRTVVYGTDTPALDVTGRIGSCVVRRRDAR